MSPRPDPAHRVSETSDAAEFLRSAAPLLAAHPYPANVLATVAGTRATQAAGTGDARWWTVRDATGAVVGAAGQTGARQVLLSPMPPAAAAALAAAIDSSARRRVHGPPDVAAAYAAAIPGIRPRTVRVEIVRVLDELRRPAVPGSARRETNADLPVLVDWMAASADEMGTAGPGAGRAEAAAGVEQRRARTGFLLWTVDGRPRSVAGWARSGAVARIGPVYTPPAERRHGYGSAVTAALADDLRTDGATVMLLADEANATSNHIYAELGFAAVDRLALLDLVDTSGVSGHPGTD
ncbi:GNAT family N-acetyltransferase [Nakamurella flava]|uniref:GNAT family N-acetyltransferase n=1 Tax=Nakamurella flava TaxID=2576308 RepID=A0A4U6QF53_9ACTN|nr:GNAT family N-acetyltransferase [Nakamurella flava]TKV58813.1 GNAT family N-acetyltransferase [Nakamurella flava]